MRLSGSLAIFGLLAAPFTVVHAYPSAHHHSRETRDVEALTNELSIKPRADAGDFYLRIMPLGASITEGIPKAPGDDEGNGYRKYLRDYLRMIGWKVNMVGNRQAGKMADRDHEGKGGDVITQCIERAERSVADWFPNLVLINVGTNDARGGGANEAKSRMKSLIDTVFSRVPDAVVVLSTLLPSDHQDAVDNINKGYRELVREYTYDRNGRPIETPEFKVVLADMVPFVEWGDIHDNIHPTVFGFKKMAAVWADSINKAHERGWLKKPSDTTKMPDDEASRNCRKEYGTGASLDPRGKTQILWAANAVIADDGDYRHKSVEHRDLLNTKVPQFNYDPRQLYFAQLVNGDAFPGGELDEMIFVLKDDKGIQYRMNHGNGNFDDWIDLDVKGNCIVRGIRWGDVNGDGLDDFICINLQGEMFVSINRGGGARGKAPRFENIGRYRGPLRGRPQSDVRLADIDGDGRLDYCVLESNGDIYCERNGGIGDHAQYWQDFGQGKPIFTGKNKGDARGVRFVDINGDGRSDWLWLDKEGQVDTYINQRGDGKGMIPHWRAAGITHGGMFHDIGDNREKVQFGRIYGTGRHDYAEYVLGSDAKSIQVHVWENVGTGGRFQKGDGVYWGDFTKSGFDDYAFITPNGEVNVFRNKVTQEKFDDYRQSPWDGPYPALKTGLDRRALHIADWNGDGYADVIGVTDRRSGSIAVWETKWSGSGFSWTRRDIGGTNKCSYGWGRMYHDHAAHFADIDGDGRADYLCMRPSGLVTALINKKDGLEDVGQVKFSEDLDRANFKFADADGDGLADMIWTDKFNGDGRIWYNGGRQPNREGLAGSLWFWEKMSTLSYQGSHRGPNMHFPSLGGLGRADMVGVEATSAKAWLWFNSCGAGGDDWPEGSPVPDPQLPGYTAPDPGEGNPPGEDDPSDHPFCNGSASAWNAELWNKESVGDWFLRRSEFYSGPDSSWHDGVPRSIAEYNGHTKDYGWNWPSSCLTANTDCHISATELKAGLDCKNQWERPFTLWAAGNYAKFIQLIYSEITDAVSTASLSTAAIAKRLSVESGEQTAQSKGWLTMMLGITSVIGTFAPPGPGEFVNFAGAALVTFNGIDSALDKDSTEPEFENFAGLQNNLGKFKELAQDAINEYHQRLFRQQPPNNNMDRGTELSKALMSGAWAEQDHYVANLDKRKIVKTIRSAVMTELWNSQKMVIVRWRDDQLRDIKMNGGAKFSWSPCFGLSDVLSGLDKFAGCYKDGVMNHAFVSYSKEATQNIWRYQGTSEKDLAEFGFTVEEVIRTAFDRQAVTGNWMDRGSGYFKDLLKNMADSNDISRITYQFNMPVCDLTALSSIRGPGLSSCRNARDCLNEMIPDNCSRLGSRGGERFPY